MNRKHGVLAAVLVLAVPLAVVATAFACGSLATLKLSRAAAKPGDQIFASGGNFNSSPRASTVQLRFNSRSGAVLWEGRPNPNGRLGGSFAAPAARPGHYVIVATQIGPDGRPAAGTPGRAPLRIKKAAGGAQTSGSVPAALWGSAPGGGGPSPQTASGSLVTVLAAGAVTMLLLGGGIALVSAGRRRRVHVARSLS
jgi:hypothetical protein